MEKNKEMSLTGGFDLRPQNLEQAMQFAKLMAESELVPKDFRGKPGNVLIAVQMGAEIGVPPMQAIQNIAVINGRPGIYGDLGKALLHSKGFKIEERDVVDTKKTGIALCKVTRPDGSVTERTYSLEDAKTAGLWGKQGPWTTNPYRQMAWRAFWFAARDGASDILKGLAGAEELIDTEKSVETTAVTMPKRLEEKAAETTAGPAISSAPAPEAEPEPVEATVFIADVKKFIDGHFEVIDSEGVTYKTLDAVLAGKMKELKGKNVVIQFVPVEGEMPTLRGTFSDKVTA